MIYLVPRLPLFRLMFMSRFKRMFVYHILISRQSSGFASMRVVCQVLYYRMFRSMHSITCQNVHFVASIMPMSDCSTMKMQPIKYPIPNSAAQPEVSHTIITILAA